MRRNHLLVLCHDFINAQLDRRITQQVDVWRGAGWDVTVVGMSTNDSSFVERWENGTVCVKIDVRHLLPVFDEDWENQVTQARATAAGNCAGSNATQEDLTASTARPGVRRRLQRGIAALSISENTEAMRMFWRMLPLTFRSTVRERFIVPVELEQREQAFQREQELQRERELQREQALWYPLPFTTSLHQVGRHLRPNAILACDLTTLPAAVQIRNETGASILYDAHELYPEQAGFKTGQRTVLQKHEREGIRAVSIAYTVSDAFAALMQEAYALETEVRVLTNAPDFQPRSDRSGRLRAATGIDDRQRLLLYHGGFSPFRNLDVLIRGFCEAHLEDTHLVMMGFGDENIITNALHGLNNSDRVHVVPAAPASELNIWVGDADFVVIPYPAVDKNTEYCSPNKLYDCIALGVPIVANRSLKNVSAILQRYGIGISADMESPSSTAESLQYLNSFSFGMAQFDRARRELGWTAQKEKLRSWISEIETSISGEWAAGARCVG